MSGEAGPKVLRVIHYNCPHIWEELHSQRERIGSDTGSICAYIDHGVGRDPEECGPLVDLLDLFAAVGRQPQGLQLAEGALQRGAVLGYQVVARAQVLHFAGQGPEGILQLRLVRL